MWGLETGSPDFHRGQSLPDSGLSSREGGRGLGPILPLSAHLATLEQGLTSLGLRGRRGCRRLGQWGNGWIIPDVGGGRCYPRPGPPSARLRPSAHS